MTLAIRDQVLTIAGLLTLLTALWAGTGLGVVGWLGGLAYLAVFLLLLADRRALGRRLGPADRVTLVRAVLIGGAAALVVDRLGQGAPPEALVPLAAAALVLDTVDGYVARRTRTESRRGARFDMEVDAFLLLVLSVHVATSLGGWVLAIGMARYAFGLATWLVPRLRSSLPPSRARQFVAAAQGIVLVVTAAELLPTGVATAIVATALALLIWSFGRDVLWLLRTSPALPH